MSEPIEHELFDARTRIRYVVKASRALAQAQIIQCIEALQRRMRVSGTSGIPRPGISVTLDFDEMQPGQAREPA